MVLDKMIIAHNANGWSALGLIASFLEPCEVCMMAKTARGMTDVAYDDMLWRKFYGRQWGTTISSQDPMRAAFRKRWCSEKQPWEASHLEDPVVQDEAFDFLMVVKQRPKTPPETKTVRRLSIWPGTRYEYVEQKTTQDEIAAYYASAEYRKYDQRDKNGPFRLIFEGRVTISLKANSKSVAKMKVKNTVKPWIEDYIDVPLEEFERLEASMIVHRHSDGAMAGIWKDRPPTSMDLIAYDEDDDVVFGGDYWPDQMPLVRRSFEPMCGGCDCPRFGFKTTFMDWYEPDPKRRQWPPPVIVIWPSQHHKNLVNDTTFELVENNTENAFLAAMTYAPIKWQK